MRQKYRCLLRNVRVLLLYDVCYAMLGSYSFTRKSGDSSHQTGILFSGLRYVAKVLAPLWDSQKVCSTSKILSFSDGEIKSNF